ncbi:MAG: EAL domain-containing protein [Rhodospirillaceae bacterium]|jgi:PAS domain S-box-containing protein|nr:EAL domain-containing protein [Rhodospirillaceae bacterium]
MLGTQALFDARLDATSGAVMVTDQSGTVVRVNAAIEKLTGYSEKGLSGNDATDLFGEFNDEGFFNELWSVDDQSRRDFNSVRSKHADGKAQINNTAAIARAIILFSKGLGLEVTAEGAELIEHVDFLRENGCDLIQGFFYSRPVPAHELEKLLQQSALMND